MDLAARVLDLIQQRLLTAPPPGVDVEFARGWFAEHEPVLLQVLAAALEGVAKAAPKSSEGGRKPEFFVATLRRDGLLQLSEQPTRAAAMHTYNLMRTYPDPEIKKYAAGPGKGKTRDEIARDLSKDWNAQRATWEAEPAPAPATPDDAPASETPLPDLPPDEWTPKERTAANLAAIQVLSRAEAAQRPLTPEERQVVLRYSGWGGLSIDKIADQVPEAWRPEERGLIHEYYTPSKVAREVARVVRPLLPELQDEDGQVPALEPSAGIGRFVHALSGPGFGAVKWTAVEYSAISGRLLQRVRPDVTVVLGTPFERWVAENEVGFAGALRLLVSNPPYGPRGASLTEDPDRSYREGVLRQKAYAYFLARGLDLLAPGGLGIFLIPYGFLTGNNAALRGLRARILKRHHLAAAYRLPSALFPGALLVTDLLFFRARGGELAQVLPQDESILDGKYFEVFPQHILGTEAGKGGDEDDSTRKPRWGYEVRGTFTTLPDLVERPLCRDCAVTSFRKETSRRAKAAPVALPDHVQAAVQLGDRVADFLRARAAGTSGDPEAAKRAAALYPELRDALTVWAQHHGLPASDPALGEYAAIPELVALRSAFQGSGLAPVFDQVPVYEPRYTAGPEDIGAQAEFLYQQAREVPLAELTSFHERVGGSPHPPAHFIQALASAGWCRDGDVWIPARDYYTGNLWPRYDRAAAAAAAGDALAAAQAAQLLGLIKPATIDEIAPEPRMPFDLEVLRAWLAEWCGIPALPPLERDGGLVKLATMSYVGLSLGADVGRVRVGVALGYLNHDYTLFKVPREAFLGGERYHCDKEKKPVVLESGRVVEIEESDKEAQDRCRIHYHKTAVAHFRQWLEKNPEHARTIESWYNRTFRGWVTPAYGQDDLQIARWRGTFVLKPHQRAGARRLLANRRGLLAFDVGVGKTLTGIATIAKAREEGWAKRPVVVVPNTIVWKWHKEFRKAVPDYRVVVIGSNRFTLSRGPRKGQLTSDIDTPEERALKWRAFQQGQYDVALITYSVLGRNSIRAESVRAWLEQSPAVLRELGLKARNLLGDLEKAKQKGTKAGEKRQAQRAELERKLAGIKDMTERERAIAHEVRDAWVAERLEHVQPPDPGIYWEELGVDLVVVDEAQNFKNLFAVDEREGGMPKFLGGIQEGSDRAWDLALRAAVVRQRTGGGGVILLSATPAKNSPIEYFSLLSIVDDQAWTRLGILDAEVYVDRYLKLDYKKVLENDGGWKMRSVVSGFRNLDELRELVFRYSEFRTAEEVGLKLPPVEQHQVLVDLDDDQRVKYSGYVTKLQSLAKAMGREGGASAKYAMLGTLQKMALVSLHSALDLGDWTWERAGAFEAPHAPKLDSVRDRILEKPDCGHIVFCDNVAVHAWMVRVLVEAGVPRERIAVLNAIMAGKPAERQAIAEGFNGDAEGGIPPKYDIVIANAVAYEGIDLQVRTCTVHHLDLPWEPATLQQRNGRAVRQGNTQAVIAIYYYLARRSFDGNRLQMILGKLRWMKDLLQSADRETSNPAAGSEMSPEEMVLMVAEDEAAAQRFKEEMARKREQEAEEQVRAQSWDALKAITTKVATLEAADELLRAQRRREIEELAGYLLSVEPAIWPWAFLVPLAKEGRPFSFKEGAIWDGARMVMGETGTEYHVEGGRVSQRALGQLRWAPRIGGAGTERHVQANNPSAFLQPWPEEADRAGWRAELTEWLDDIAANRWVNFEETLGLAFAPGRWKALLWETAGAELIEALAIRQRRDYTPPVPVREPGGEGLRLLQGQDLRGREADVIPFTPEGLTEYLARAPQTEYRWRELNAAALVWFGQKIPQGLLAREEAQAA